MVERVAKNYSIFDIGYSKIGLLMIHGILTSIFRRVNELPQFFTEFWGICVVLFSFFS